MSWKLIFRICWTISFIVWIFFAVQLDATYMWISLGFMWLFYFIQRKASDKKFEKKVGEVRYKKEEGRYKK